jgi:hypothetical protein
VQQPCDAAERAANLRGAVERLKVEVGRLTVSHVGRRRVDALSDRTDTLGPLNRGLNRSRQSHQVSFRECPSRS